VKNKKAQEKTWTTTYFFWTDFQKFHFGCKDLQVNLGDFE